MVVEGDVIIEVAIYYCSLYYKKTFMSSDLVLFAARDGGSVREDAGFFFLLPVWKFIKPFSYVIFCPLPASFLFIYIQLAAYEHWHSVA